MSDTLRWRRVWITARPGRRARFCINWIGDDGAPHRLAYPSRKVRDVARRLKEQEINSWARPPMVVPWLELVAQYGLALAPQSPAHQEKVARVLGRFQRITRPVQSNMITPAMCDQFMAARAAGELASGDGPRLPSAFTLRDDRAILSAFFAWCVARAYMPANPMEHVHTPRTPRRIPRPPRPADWLKLLQALLKPDLAVHDAQAWHVLILLGIVSGFRQSVLLHCYFGFDVTDRRRLELLEQRHRRDGGFCVVQLPEGKRDVGLLFTYTGKTMKENLTGVPRVVADRIAQRIGDLPAGTAGLFPWRRWQRKAWERINKAAGIDLTFKSLRAASGTQAAIAKAEQAASRHLEHSSRRVTREHYLDPEVVARAVAIGQSLPRLPQMPHYGTRSVERSIPGRQPGGIGQSGQP